MHATDSVNNHDAQRQPPVVIIIIIVHAGYHAWHVVVLRHR